MLHLLTRLLVIIVLFGGITYIFMNYKPTVSGSDVDQLISAIGGPASGWEKCGDECEQKIRELIGQAVATLSASPTSAPASKSKATSAPKVETKISYINLTNVGLTTRNEWTDLDGTDFAYDAGIYGNVKEVRWVPRIRTNSGGEASSRLYDVSSGIAVSGSEVSTRNTSFTEVESSVLTLKSSKSTYRVQIKATLGNQTEFETGKVKITSQ